MGLNVIWNGEGYYCEECLNFKWEREKEEREKWEKIPVGKLEIRCMDCNSLLSTIPVITNKEFAQIKEDWKWDICNNKIVVLVGNHLRCDRQWRLV